LGKRGLREEALKPEVWSRNKIPSAKLSWEGEEGFRQLTTNRGFTTFGV